MLCKRYEWNVSQTNRHTTKNTQRHCASSASSWPTMEQRYKEGISSLLSSRNVCVLTERQKDVENQAKPCNTPTHTLIHTQNVHFPSKLYQSTGLHTLSQEREHKPRPCDSTENDSWPMKLTRLPLRSFLIGSYISVDHTHPDRSGQETNRPKTPSQWTNI